MIRALWTASTGLQAQQLNIDVVANNLANVNTSGFKRGRADFQDLLYQTLRMPGTATSGSTEVPTGIQVGHGAKVVAVQKMFNQGDFMQTLNELDMVVEGNGFFQITKPDGETAYTRAGAFKLDSDGRVVTSDGYALEPEISIPDDTTNITIGADGTVSVVQTGDATAVAEVGNIETAMFANEGGLLNIGKSLYMPSEASGCRNPHFCQCRPGFTAPQCECAKIASPNFRWCEAESARFSIRTAHSRSTREGSGSQVHGRSAPGRGAVVSSPADPR